MKRYKAWQADYFGFTVAGRGAQNFLTLCGGNGVKLWQLHCTENGYAARAAGRDRHTLEAFAKRGGWQFEITARSGPGRWLEKLLARPGIVLGALLFALLVKLLGNFVWTIDFGTVERERQLLLRESLLQSGICEGAWLTQEALQAAERTLLQQTEEYGWLSLHFNSGCLFLESSPLQRQQVQQGAGETALYAKCNALILSMSVKSGFAAAAPGQYVARGQLLVDNVKFGRTGTKVSQGAQGTVLARVEMTCRASCPLQTERELLTGRYGEERTLYLLGRKYDLTQQKAPTPALAGKEIWQPLRCGAFALPGCVRLVPRLQTARQTVRYSAKTAQAIAARACKLQLHEAYPDAKIETEEKQVEQSKTAVQCSCRYVFTANIAEPGAPPEHSAPAENA